MLTSKSFAGNHREVYSMIYLRVKIGSRGPGNIVEGGNPTDSNDLCFTDRPKVGEILRWLNKTVKYEIPDRESKIKWTRITENSSWRKQAVTKF